MRARTHTAICSLALSLLLVLPSVAQGQQRNAGELIREINEALNQNPTSSGSYAITIDNSGTLVAEKSDGSGVLVRWEIYVEDIASVSQTMSGQVYVNCAEDVGRCAKVTCRGTFANFAGCVRGGSSAAHPRYAEALELAYGYDTRAMRVIGAAFDELMAMAPGN